MTRLTLFLAASAAACSVDSTGAVANAVNTDPGATSMSFHSPQSGIDFEIRTVKPQGQPDPIYMKFSGVDGEPTGQSRDVIFRGAVDGLKTHLSPIEDAAILAPITAVLLGQTTEGQVQESLSLNFTKIEINYVAQPPPCETSSTLIKQAVAYAELKEGPAAGELATAYLAELGVDPCLTWNFKVP